MGYYIKENIHLCGHSTCNWSRWAKLSSCLSLSSIECYRHFLLFRTVCTQHSAALLQRANGNGRGWLVPFVWVVAQGYGEGGVFRELQDPPWLLPVVPWYCKGEPSRECVTAVYTNVNSHAWTLRTYIICFNQNVKMCTTTVNFAILFLLHIKLSWSCYSIIELLLAVYGSVTLLEAHKVMLYHINGVYKTSFPFKILKIIICNDLLEQFSMWLYTQIQGVTITAVVSPLGSDTFSIFIFPLNATLRLTMICC